MGDWVQHHGKGYPFDLLNEDGSAKEQPTDPRPHPRSGPGNRRGKGKLAPGARMEGMEAQRRAGRHHGISEKG
jgi:hypothetical protein